MDLKNQNNVLLKNADIKIQKRLHEYHNAFINEKMEFDNILTKNQDILDKVKRNTDIVDYLKEEIKSGLQTEIFSYKKEIKNLLTNKELQKELQKLNHSSSNILNNILLNKDTINLIKSLKNNIDTSLTSTISSS